MTGLCSSTNIALLYVHESSGNLLGFALSGPIIKKRNQDGTKGSSILGYFISGELRSVDDTDPSAIGRWKVKDDVLEEEVEMVYVHQVDALFQQSFS